MTRWLLICAMLISGSLLAEPLRLEAQGGFCKQGVQGDGIWWSSLYEHEIDLRSECWQFGISKAPWAYNNWKLGWRTAYVDLGEIKANTVFTMLEPQYKTDGLDCDKHTMEGCLGRGIIEGRTRGVSIGGLAEHKLGDWRLGIEGGSYVYYSRFDVVINSEPVPGKFAAQKQSWGDILVSPYLGLTANYAYFFATTRVYTVVQAHEHGCGGCSGITGGSAYQIMVGIQVPF